MDGQPYTFDANGNLLATGVMTNTWDAANRLVSSTRDGNTIRPIYNGVNDRVGQVVDGVQTDFALDVIGLPEVISTTNGARYLHLPGVIVTEKAGEVKYLLSDGLGSIRQVVDKNAAVIAYYEFDPYGNPVSDKGGEPYGYTGEWWEDDVQFLHLRARWYLPEDGIFLSRDPVEAEPPYQYVRGNPVNWVDPSGQYPDEMLDTFLGENWESVYFFGDCINDGVFAGRDNLYQFMVSENTYDHVTLSIITVAFNEAWLMSQAGLSFDADSPIDAMGFSLRGSVGGVGFGAGSFEGILNLTSGEFSIFGSGGGGVLFGADVGITGGPYFVRNLPSNANYRNYFGSVGIVGGHGAGGTAEAFWGAPKTNPMSEGTYGGFVGGGPVEGLGIYGGYNFFYELVRIDITGYHLLPDPFDYRPDDIIPIIRDDIIGTLSDYFARLYGLN